MLIPQLSLADLDVVSLKRFLIVGPVRLVVHSDSRSEDEEQSQLILQQLEALLNAGMNVFRRLYVGPISATSLDLITRILDFGIEYVVVTGKCEEIYRVIDELPKDRILVQVSDLNDPVLPDLLQQDIGGIIYSVPDCSLEELKSQAKSLWSCVGKRAKKRILAVNDSRMTSVAPADIEQLVGEFHHTLGGYDYPIHLSCSASLPIDGVESNKDVCVGKCFISCLRTDRTDGLYTTVVTDEFDVALGLVYSSKESIIASISYGRGVYWSRSRNSLWKKGDTSGAFQELISIGFDCDCDAVKFSVIQHGAPPAFCHTGERDCWASPTEGLGGLFRKLEDRKINAEEGSYTQRLYNDRALLRNKLLEESQELIEAVEENDPTHVSMEAADLLYFTLTACCSGNASLHQVVQQLDRRALKVKRRPGNAKQFRIDQASELLNKITKD